MFTMPDPTSRELDRPIRPQRWDIDTFKEKVRLGAIGRNITWFDGPRNINLDPTWSGIYKDAYEQPIHMAIDGKLSRVPEIPRIFKLSPRGIFLLQEVPPYDPTLHLPDSAYFSTFVNPGERFIGSIHNHPAFADVSSEDVTVMLEQDLALFIGLATPNWNDLLVKTSSTPDLPNDPKDIHHHRIRSLVINAGILNNREVHQHPSTENPAFTLTPKDLQDLGILLYRGRRDENILHLING